MIHEFMVLLENNMSGEELEQPGAINMSRVQMCYDSPTDVGCTVVQFFGGEDRCTVRCDIKDFLDIWRTCTENINLNM